MEREKGFRQEAKKPEESQPSSERPEWARRVMAFDRNQIEKEAARQGINMGESETSNVEINIPGQKKEKGEKTIRLRTKPTEPEHKAQMFNRADIIAAQREADKMSGKQRAEAPASDQRTMQIDQSKQKKGFWSKLFGKK